MATVDATPAASTQPAAPSGPQDQPPTSTGDDGSARRPRDARLIHLILSSLGIHSYQERVPLQLLDFAYRYTSSVLSDSLRLSADGYAATGPTGRKAADVGDGSAINVSALRQAIASRGEYTFQGRLSKEFMMEQAAEKNRVILPRIGKGWGVQLPAERYCLTGSGWTLKDEWESEDEVGEVAVENHKVNGNDVGPEGDEGDQDDEMDQFEEVMGGEPQDRETNDLHS